MNQIRSFFNRCEDVDGRRV